MSVIGLTRCVVLVSPARGGRVLSGGSGVAAVALVWLYANCAMIPGYLGVLNPTDILVNVITQH